MKRQIKWIPAHWRVSDIDDGWKDVVEDSEGRFVAVIHDELAEKAGKEVAEACSRLIAAAPEMLEALQELVDTIDNGITMSENDFISLLDIKMRTAKNVIKKALGE